MLRSATAERWGDSALCTGNRPTGEVRERKLLRVEIGFSRLQCSLCLLSTDETVAAPGCFSRWTGSRRNCSRSCAVVAAGQRDVLIYLAGLFVMMPLGSRPARGSLG